MMSENMHKIKFGIVGYGKMGQIRSKVISKITNAEIVAIYDVEKKKLKNGIKFCSSLDELLNEDIDAVIISGYTVNSKEFTIRALNQGKHVFCEKPPAMNAKEVKKVINFEKKNKKILKYGFNHRFHFSVIEAKKIIDKNKFGKIILMRGIYGKAGSLDFHKNWRNYKKYTGGGILMDQGIHMLDLFRFLSGQEFRCHSSIIQKLMWKVEFEDNAFAILKSKKNIIASLHSSATQWKHKFLLEIILEKGFITLDGILSSTNSYAPERMIIGSNGLNNIKQSMGKPSEKKINFSKDKSWQLEIEEFIKCIQKKSKVKNGNSNDALNVMKLVDEIYSKGKLS